MAKALIYSTALCGYCTAAKNFLDTHHISYEEIRVDLESAKREEMINRTQRRTVPQIFIDDRHIGGYEDLVQFARTDEFARLVGEN